MGSHDLHQNNPLSSIIISLGKSFPAPRLAANMASFLSKESERTLRHILGTDLRLMSNVLSRLEVLHPNELAARPSGSARASNGKISLAAQSSNLGIGLLLHINPAFNRDNSVRKIVTTLRRLLPKPIFCSYPSVFLLQTMTSTKTIRFHQS